MNLSEFFDYKNTLMKEICSNERLVQLITGNKMADVPNHALPYSQVFPFEFIPETVDEGRTYICFDVDIVEAQSKTFYTPVIYIWVFTHKSLLRAPDGGILLDMISEELDKMLNGSRFYSMGELNLRAVTRFVPISDYQGRALAYTAKDFNRLYANRPVPTNRKKGT